MERKDGFYWVQTDDEIWHVAEWQDGVWYMPEIESPFGDLDFILISNSSLNQPN